MRKTVLLVLPLLLSACAGVKPIARGERLIAAVMPMSYAVEAKEYASIVDGLADSLAGGLVRTGRLRLVERQRVEAALAEMHYEHSGAVDTKLAAKIGAQLGADAVVIGAVTSLSVKDEWRTVKIAEKTTRYAEVAVEARLVHVATGELLASGRAIGKSKTAEKHAFGGKIGELASKESVVQSAMVGLGDKVAEQMAPSIPPKSEFK